MYDEDTRLSRTRLPSALVFRFGLIQQFNPSFG